MTVDIQKNYLLIVAVLLLCFKGFSQTAQTGMASYYHDKFDGRPTASGEAYKAVEMTAAHASLPFGTLLRVTNVDNAQSVIVRVNDRGPFVGDRILDLSKAAAMALDLLDRGVALVRIEVLTDP